MKDKNKKFLIRKGQVLEALPSLNFRIRLDDGEEIMAHLAGRLKLSRIRVLPGDNVTVELSPYDKKRGRIVYRGK
jgi:translation initiation factor IF-1